MDNKEVRYHLTSMVFNELMGMYRQQIDYIYDSNLSKNAKEEYINNLKYPTAEIVNEYVDELMKRF